MDLITLSILKPKTETEIFQIIKKMSPSEIFRLAIKHNIVRLVDYAVSQGLNLQDVYGKYCYQHYGYGNIKIRYKKNVSYLEFLYLHHKGLLDHILKKYPEYQSFIFDVSTWAVLVNTPLRIYGIHTVVI